MMQGGIQLTHGNFYAISYVTCVGVEDACRPILQWKSVTNVDVYDLLLSKITAGNALSRGWEQVLSLFKYTCILCGNSCALLISSILVFSTT